jgi:hypothetical protein
MTLKSKLKLSVFLIIISLTLAAPLSAQFSLDMETGFVSASKNDVRIPGDQGTLISLTDDLAAASSFFIRAKGGYRIRERHIITALVAPLSMKSDGFLPYDVSFAGVVFPADSMLDANYKFNSYRLTYRYDIVLRDKVEFGLGITAKLRDAAISMKAPGYYAEKTNTGFVPLINFRLLLMMDERLGLLIEGDALGASQGRAEDILFAAQYKISEKMQMHVGYRLLEGGADNDEVYNFSMFNYGSLGFTYTFR